MQFLIREDRIQKSELRQARKRCTWKCVPMGQVVVHVEIPSHGSSISPEQIVVDASAWIPSLEQTGVHVETSSPKLIGNGYRATFLSVDGLDVEKEMAPL